MQGQFLTRVNEQFCWEAAFASKGKAGKESGKQERQESRKGHRKGSRNRSLSC